MKFPISFGTIDKYILFPILSGIFGLLNNAIPLKASNKINNNPLIIREVHFLIPTGLGPKTFQNYKRIKNKNNNSNIYKRSIYK